MSEAFIASKNECFKFVPVDGFFDVESNPTARTDVRWLKVMFGFGIAMEIVRTARSIQPACDLPTSVVIDTVYREVSATHMEWRDAGGFLFLGFR